MTKVIAGLRWVVRLEIGIWKSLGLLAMRRTAGLKAGDEAFPYIGHVSLVLFGFIFASMCELPLLHVLIPWEHVRLTVDIISIWGLLWMIGYAASLKVFPHLVGPDALRIRNGAHTEIVVPWAAVATVTAKRRDTEKDRFQVVDGIALLPILKETNVEVTLADPTVIATPKGDALLTEIRFHVDDVKGFVAAVRARAGVTSG